MRPEIKRLLVYPRTSMETYHLPSSKPLFLTREDSSVTGFSNREKVVRKVVSLLPCLPVLGEELAFKTCAC